MTEIKGYDKLAIKLKKLQNPTKPIRKGMDNYMGFLRKKVVPYPPHTQANVKPGVNGYSWYERGYGVRTITGKAYRTSELMNRRWSFRTRILANVVRGYIRNEASYSIYVQGELQTRYHSMRGWPRVDKVMVASSNMFVRFVGKEIDRELRK